MSLEVVKVTLEALQYDCSKNESRMSKAISTAFGPDGLGILLVDGLSEQFKLDREDLLAAARALSSLSEEKLRELELPDVDYSTGWSRGRETFKGVLDKSKGSFYANPLYDDPACGDANLSTRYLYDMHPNIWPSDTTCKLLEPSFKRIGRYINIIGLHIARHCDQFVKEKLGNKANFTSLESSLRDSRVAKGRLLNYFPSESAASASVNAADSKEDLWCGYHNDHGTLTGLISGQFYNSVTQQPLPASPDAVTGLYICRQGSTVSEKVSIPPECIAFQIGEVAQIASGGVLRATPHAVRMPLANAENVSRATLAVFLQPNPWEPLQMPDHLEPADRLAALETSDLVPSLANSRYEASDTFETFGSKTIQAYCQK